jgi:hypothetical protein
MPELYKYINTFLSCFKEKFIFLRKIYLLKEAMPKLNSLLKSPINVVFNK